VHCSWIDEEAESELTYSVESLQVWVLYDLVYYSLWYVDKSEDRVVDDFSGFRHVCEIVLKSDAKVVNYFEMYKYRIKITEQPH
jgi:hypothetical protein